MESDSKIDMQVLPNSHAVLSLMPHFEGGEKTRVETLGREATESACIGATIAGVATNGCLENGEPSEKSGTLPPVDSTKSSDPTGKRWEFDGTTPT